ncbi:acyltransferase family protein [Streptomyces sp. NPDC048718]|uniref:acyltransferase family protein n=1 Tax=Streptomyces sp. NPDC048718 TaxID=3365587 RepID=UPI003710DB4F
MTGLRWFAAFGVFLFHARGYFAESKGAYELAALGYEGVPFFFVLSGFIMAWVARPSDSAPHYYARRFARIWPLLAVTTALTVGMMKAWWHVPVSGADIAWTLTFGQAWTTGHFMTMNVVTWTLSVEAFFYLVFPPLLWLLLRRSSRALLAVAGLCVLTTAGTRVAAALLERPAEVERLLYASPPALTPMFVVGVCAGLLVRRGARPPVRTGAACALVAGVALLCRLWMAHPDALDPLPGAIGSFDALLVPVFALLIAAAAVGDLDGRPSFLRSPTLVRLGEWSFAYYLCHAVVLKAVRHLGYGPGPGLLSNLAVMTVAALAALGVAALLHSRVEKPAERRLRRLLPTRTSDRASDRVSDRASGEASGRTSSRVPQPGRRAPANATPPSARAGEPGQ